MTTTFGRRRFLMALLSLPFFSAVAVGQQEKKKKNKQKKDKKKKDNKAAEDGATVKPAELASAYERGAYREIIDKVESVGATNPEALFFAGLSYEGLKASGSAQREYQQLAARPDNDAWRHVGESAIAVSGGNLATALSAVNRAIELDGNSKYAHYQRGWVLLNQKDYTNAVASFQRVLELDGNFAYGHYYAGVCYNQTRNLVAMSHHWERFLVLAPEAPERLQVESVLKSVRG